MGWLVWSPELKRGEKVKLTLPAIETEIPGVYFTLDSKGRPVYIRED